jgi:alpha,alpha-trehalase
MMQLDEQARTILRENDRGGYTVPTAGLYPYQWNWDSVFVALGFATFDADRAWRELETLFEAQWPDGMVPHIIFRVDEPSYFPGPSVWNANKGPLPSSGITQPPVAATVVRALAAQDPERARPFLAKLNAWHEWFHAARDPQRLGVIAITHPWESGRDNLPDWDKPGDLIDISQVGEYTRRDTALVDADMRPKKRDYDRYLALVQFGVAKGWDQDVIAAENPFFVADPGMSAIFLRAERDLAALAEQLGAPITGIEARIARLEAGFDRLWNPQAGNYCALDLRSGVHAEAATAASFLALYAGVTARKEALTQELAAWADRAEYLVPSFDPRSTQFDHLRYWRGPVWAMVNWMIAKGFAEEGQPDWADRIRADTARLIKTGGFAEYFSPNTGEGCGGGTFSWTAAIWLAWGLGEVN